MKGLSWFSLLLCLSPSSCSLGRHGGYGASELCEVNSRTKVGEGYHIAGVEQCNTFCKMTRGCHWWTWYSHLTQDQITKDHVCFALSSCELVTQKCDQCSSGKKNENTISKEQARRKAKQIIEAERRRRQEL